MNETEKRSYALGCDIGNNLKTMGLPIEKEAFAQGVMDAINGTMSMTIDELNAQFALINKELEENQKKLANAEKEAGVKFLKENKANEGVVETKSGLQYKVITMGAGEKPSATDTVKVHYHGTLIDGTVFDSSIQRGEPIEFPLNRDIGHDIIAGTFFIAGFDDETGDFKSLTKEQIDKYKKRFDEKSIKETKEKITNIMLNKSIKDCIDIN